MEILNYESAFGAQDVSSEKMQEAVGKWFRLYYRDKVEEGLDPCQRIAYTVVSKLVRWVFAEYRASAKEDFARQLLQALDGCRVAAVQMALIGGECYIKPVFTGRGFSFRPVPRNRILVFGRDAQGEPTDVGTVEQSVEGGWYYTLLERRYLTDGYLTVENRLFRSKYAGVLGFEVPLDSHPAYRDFLPSYTFREKLNSVGLVRMKTPQLNCVDGSNEGVSVYAPAAGLIDAIDRNEWLLNGEFERGQSRVFASRDLLQDEGLQDNLFVGLDEDPEQVGLTVFAPQLRHQAFLERKREYLRNVEAVIGLQRGVLSDVANMQRTATEISATAAEHCLTVMDFQRMWEDAVQRVLSLCVALGHLYGLPGGDVHAEFDWGNGVLYDEEKLWQEYKDMVAQGLLAPEVALGWRFNLPSETEEQRAYIRKKYMS